MKLWKPLAAATAAALATGLMVAPAASAASATPGGDNPAADNFYTFYAMTDDIMNEGAIRDVAQTAATMKVSHLADGIRTSVTVSGDLVKIARSARVTTPGLRPVTIRENIVCKVSADSGWNSDFVEDCVTRVGRVWYPTFVNIQEIPGAMIAWGDPNTTDYRTGGAAFAFFSAAEQAYDMDPNATGKLRTSPFVSPVTSAAFSGKARFSASDSPIEGVTVSLRAAARVAPTRNGMRWDYSYTGKYSDASSPEMIEYFGGPKISGKVTITSSTRATRISYPTKIQQEGLPYPYFSPEVRVPYGFFGN